MKFKYPKRKKTLNLIIGLLWIALGVFAVLEDEAKNYEYVWLVFGLFYFGLAIYMQVANYVSVDKQKIVKHNLVPITIQFSEITNVKEKAGRIIIESEGKKMKIYKNNIQKNQLSIFEEAIAKIKEQYSTPKY